MIVKLCGITSVDDALAALDAGADWIGLNMVAGPRRIDLQTVGGILSEIPDPSRATVLVSLRDATIDGSAPIDALAASSAEPPASLPTNEKNTTTSDSHRLLDELFALDVRRLQLYGPVTPNDLADLRQRGFETILVHHVTDASSLTKLDAFLNTCADARPDYLLFDAADPKRLGGTGRCANWDAIVTARDTPRELPWPPFLLAGGLTLENVASAVQAVRPAGVDASSGVEASPGRKDVDRMRRFVAQAHAVSSR